MPANSLAYAFMGVAAIPFVYYFLALYSSWQFFRLAKKSKRALDYTPPVSNLKPIRGLDSEAYENFASYCKQDYPDYELLFGIGDGDEAVLEVIEKLKRDFPQQRIRVVHVSGHIAANDKVVKLARLVGEAKNEVLVINDSDVRVRPDYLRSVVAPLRDPKVGAVTCLYVSTHEHTFIQKLQSTGMFCDFFRDNGCLAARWGQVCVWPDDCHDAKASRGIWWLLRHRESPCRRFACRPFGCGTRI